MQILQKRWRPSGRGVPEELAWDGGGKGAAHCKRKPILRDGSGFAKRHNWLGGKFGNGHYPLLKTVRLKEGSQAPPLPCWIGPEVGINIEGAAVVVAQPVAHLKNDADVSRMALPN